jgi:DNA-binding transcriptional LysR family regulator
MTLDQITAFLWVARLGGFRRAATQLNLTQPAISTRIAKLEDELATPLFDREASGLTLTRQGTLLLSYAEQLLFVTDEIRKRVADTSALTGLFRIGASETVAQSWLPDFLKAFSAVYPRINIDLTVDISTDLREGLLTRQLDLAFLMGPVSEFTVENVALPPFDLHWYCATGSGPVDLKTMPVISFSAKTRPYRELMNLLTQHVSPSVRVFTSASLSASLQIIASGVAVGPFPRALAGKLIAEGLITEFDPGLSVSPLAFTASYLGEPRNFLAENGAAIALKAAQAWHAAYNKNL